MTFYRYSDNNRYIKNARADTTKSIRYNQQVCISYKNQVRAIPQVKGFIILFDYKYLVYVHNTSKK